MAINVTQVGFGAAVLAGLILAFIGHPQPTDLPAPVTAPTPSASAPRSFVLKSVSVELPTSDVAFPGPANAITANCLSCHSAGMVLTQPDLSRTAWAAEVDKMIHAFKAPIGAADVPAIIDYLQATRGAK
jgi:hypothetical protein